jgi:hypothetical protein
LAEQISFTAFSCAFTLLARKAFITVLRQRLSWALIATALEAVADKAIAAMAKIKIDFKTGLATPTWVMGLPL